MALLRIGFLYPQQIIRNKGRTLLTRTHYWYRHEPCWYVRKKNAPWFGEAGKNSTIWDSPPPKFIMGGSDEQKFDRPTQKPVELLKRSHGFSNAGGAGNHLGAARVPGTSEPAAHDHLLLGVEGHGVFAVRVQVAEERVLPAGEGEESHGSGHPHVDSHHSDFAA
jgi:hypothetical protein